ncbi:MAG: hypothetical protein HQK52_08015 [Oligoflexia bacterium]|nr:hypothetical protein [Oligoflexia bacterium]
MNDQEKLVIGMEAKAKVDVLYAEKTNTTKGVLSYQDITQLCDWVEHFFFEKTGEIPKLIKGSMEMAKGHLSISKMKSLEHYKNALAILISAAGGFGLVCGMLAILGTKVAVWTTIWAAIAGGSTPVPIGNIAAIAASLAAISLGIYVARVSRTPEEVSQLALDALTKGIEKWSEPEKQQTKFDQEAIKLVENIKEGLQEGSRNLGEAVESSIATLKNFFKK